MRRDQLRRIARGQGEVGMEWRARWKAATKTGNPLFEGASSDWNINQVALSFWFQFYDNVYEHPERPDLKIINNDDLLDKWAEKLNKEREDRARKNSKGIKGGLPSALDHDEVIIFEEEIWEDVLDEEEDEDEENEL